MSSEHKIIFEEIINEKSPKLKIPEFNVDKKLREVMPPFPSLHSYIVFCGKSLSGKSSLLTSLLTNKDLYKKAYNNVILVIPVHSFTSISEKDNPYLYLSDDKIYHEFNF